jgi:acetyl esterase/lipase
MPSLARIVLDAFARPERHRYGPHPVNRADLWLPDGPGPHPVVVVLHGGSWKAKYGKVVMRPACADLARRGVAAWNVEYRRVGRGQGGGYPATFDDVTAAIDHLADVADGRVDLTDVRALGHSAGGQLALWAASREDAGVPLRRVAALAAPSDMVAAGQIARDFLGGSVDEVPERYAATDPIQRLPLGVPVLLVHGEEDATVPVQRSRAYLEAARAAGDDVELVVPAPGAHRVLIDPRSAGWEAAARFVTS